MSTYIVAEIGQNHNGSVELAKKLIDMAAMPIHDEFGDVSLKGVDAVKLVKRDLDHEISRQEWNRPYESRHSFGETYGAHRAALELSGAEHEELCDYAKEKGLDFVETLCAPSCLSLLDRFEPAYLKVASRDLTNVPLLKAMAGTEIPIILSTGMSGREELDRALRTIGAYHDDITILHCLSQYPAEYDALNLRSIEYLSEEYPEYRIGYSDHSIGIAMPAVAVGMGARVIEKHVTLDRNMKGSDHFASLEPDGLWRMVRDIRNVERALGERALFTSPAAEKAKQKLERSLAAGRKIARGEVIEEEDLQLLSPGDGFQWKERERIVGRTAAKEIAAGEIIYPVMVNAEHEHDAG